MLGVTAVEVVHSDIAIFDDTFQHLEWWLVNDSLTLPNPKGKGLEVSCHMMPIHWSKA